MNLKQSIAASAAVVIAFTSLAFVPASADSNTSSKASGTDVLVALNGQETPQHLVWDMTYGDLSPSEAADEPVAVAEVDDIVDMSMG